MTDHLAVAVTAAMVDQTDLVLVTGNTPVERWTDWIRVSRGDSVPVALARTPLGPVVHEVESLAGPVELALRSPAHDPGGITFTHLELLEIRTVDGAIDMARRIGGPTLGLVFGDADGRTGWVVAGAIPQRVGHDGRRVVNPDTPGVGWNGLRPESERPVLVDPANGYVFTANQRFASLETSRSLSGFWVSPTRARRLNELLELDARPDEGVHRAYQLDTRSLEHEAVRAILLRLFDDGADAPETIPQETISQETISQETISQGPISKRLLDAARNWDGFADAGSADFTDLERARVALRGAALRPVLAPVRAVYPDFRYTWLGGHEPALRILEEMPADLLPEGHADWTAYLVSELEEAFEGRERAAWGEINRARITHPFAGIFPWLDARLNLPADPLAGWAGALRAQQPDYGQSLRFVGRPGQPERATLDVPGGQSGHPLSPFYQAGHRSWVEGSGTPLMAGPARTRVQFVPPF
jgi:penicillin G amidase